MKPVKYGSTVPMTNVRNEVALAVQELMIKHHLSKSDAVRHILDMGLVYMAIYGYEKSGD